MKQKINKLRVFFQKHDYQFLIISTIIYELIIYFLNDILNTSSITLSFFLFTFLLFLFLYDKKNISKNIFYLIYIISIFIKTIYILNTNIYTRQHDIGELNNEGHLKYINIIYSSFKLPTTNLGQFYHPPLWHALSALWLRMNTIININFNTALEGIQILSLLFSSTIVIIVDKIGHKLNLNNFYCLLTDIFFAVHPTMLFFSGSINNDCLVTFFEYLIFLLLINWNENTSWKNTIILAITTGLCVMTKANGALMAIPIIYIFITKLISYIKKEKTQIKPYILKILSFASISLPIGLWFQIRDIILYGQISKIPGSNIPIMKELLTDKFFSFDLNDLFNYAYNGANNSNLPAFIIKSSIFGEWIFDKINILLKTGIITIATLLIAITITYMIGYLLYKKKNIYINMMIITWCVFILAMCQFNYQYPSTCTMDFRYIVICLLSNIMTLNYCLNSFTKKWLKIPIIIIYILFIILCLIFSISIF